MCPPEGRLIRGVVKVRRHAAMGAERMNECQMRTPWSEELDGEELHGAVDGDLEPREFALFCTSSTRRQNINSTSIYKCGIVLLLGGGVSCVFFLLSGCLFPRGLCFCTFRFEIFAHLNPRIVLLSQRMLFQGGLSPRTHAIVISLKTA